jgi:hypothetical protein
MDGWQEAGQVGELKGIFAESPPPLSGVIAPPPVPQAQTPPALPQTNAQAQNAGKEYKVGDRGPAAGWVFYDKGYYSNGWRYLEAAPPEPEFLAMWGLWDSIKGLESAVGSGKQNTDRIVDFIRVNAPSRRGFAGQQGVRGEYAAQRCVQLDFNGFKDWFLPSIDELELMYKNLKAKGLGEFKKEHDYGGTRYYSSTEYDGRHAWTIDFYTGKKESKALLEDFNYAYVRPVRQF